MSVLTIAPVSTTSNGGLTPATSITMGTPLLPKPVSETIQNSLNTLPGEDVYERPRCVSELIKYRVQKGTINKKNGKHLVLDLDETFVHTFENEYDLDRFVGQLGSRDKERIKRLEFTDGTGYYWTYIRPYAEEFLEMAFAEFESVGVWSAGSYEYVHKIVDIVFTKQRPNYIMTRNDCNAVRTSKQEPICKYKPLKNIYDARPDMNPSNTIIVDDRHDICGYNCLNNIRVPAFIIHEHNATHMAGDISLLTLAEWFQTDYFRNAKDVRSIKSDSPFRLEN